MGVGAADERKGTAKNAAAKNAANARRIVELTVSGRRPADSTAASGLRVLLRRGREACVVSNNLIRYVLRNSTLGERARGSRTVDGARVEAADVALPRPGPLGSAFHEELDVLEALLGVGYVGDTVILHHDDLHDLPGC